MESLIGATCLNRNDQQLENQQSCQFKTQTQAKSFDKVRKVTMNATRLRQEVTATPTAPTTKPITNKKCQSSLMIKSQLYQAIMQDNLQKFKNVSKKVLNQSLNEDNLKQLLDIRCHLHGNESLLFYCCKYGSIKILSFILDTFEAGKNCTLLKESLMSVNDHHSNSLLIECVIKPNISRKKVKSRKKYKNLCLDLLLNTMKVVLKRKQFKHLLRHKNDEQMNLLTLLKNDEKNNELMIKKVELYLVQTNSSSKKLIARKQKTRTKTSQFEKQQNENNNKDNNNKSTVSVESTTTPGKENVEILSNVNKKHVSHVTVTPPIETETTNKKSEQTVKHAKVSVVCVNSNVNFNEIEDNKEKSKDDRCYTFMITPAAASPEADYNEIVEECKQIDKNSLFVDEEEEDNGPRYPPRRRKKRPATPATALLNRHGKMPPVSETREIIDESFDDETQCGDQGSKNNPRYTHTTKLLATALFALSPDTSEASDDNSIATQSDDHHDEYEDSQESKTDRKISFGTQEMVQECKCPNDTQKGVSWSGDGGNKFSVDWQYKRHARFPDQDYPLKPSYCVFDPQIASISKQILNSIGDNKAVAFNPLNAVAIQKYHKLREKYNLFEPFVFSHADEMIAHEKYDYYNCVFHNIHRRGNGDVFFGDFYEAMKGIGLDRDSIVRIFCRMDTEYRGCIRSFQFIGYCLGNEFVNSQLITLHDAFLEAVESVEWEEKEILFDDIKSSLDEYNSIAQHAQQFAQDNDYDDDDNDDVYDDDGDHHEEEEENEEDDDDNPDANLNMAPVVAFQQVAKVDGDDTAVDIFDDSDDNESNGEFNNNSYNDYGNDNYDSYDDEDDEEESSSSDDDDSQPGMLRRQASMGSRSFTRVSYNNEDDDNYSSDDSESYDTYESDDGCARNVHRLNNHHNHNNHNEYNEYNEHNDYNDHSNHNNHDSSAHSDENENDNDDNNENDNENENNNDSNSDDGGEESYEQIDEPLKSTMDNNQTNQTEKTCNNNVADVCPGLSIPIIDDNSICQVFTQIDGETETDCDTNVEMEVNGTVSNSNSVSASCSTSASVSANVTDDESNYDDDDGNNIFPEGKKLIANDIPIMTNLKMSPRKMKSPNIIESNTSLINIDDKGAESEAELAVVTPDGSIANQAKVHGGKGNNKSISIDIDIPISSSSTTKKQNKQTKKAKKGSKSKSQNKSKTKRKRGNTKRSKSCKSYKSNKSSKSSTSGSNGSSKTKFGDYNRYLDATRKVFKIQSDKLIKEEWIQVLSLCGVSKIYARKTFNKLDSDKQGYVNVLSLFKWISTKKCEYFEKECKTKLEKQLKKYY